MEHYYPKHGQPQQTTCIRDLWQASRTKQILLDYGSAPWVTGAYIIKTPNGMDKLSGVIECIEVFRKHDLIDMASRWQQEGSLQKAWEELVTHYFMGPFMAYEVITDLSHTPVLSGASDIYSWANAGPGAKRGCNRILGRDKDHPISQPECNRIMRALLDKSWDWGWNGTKPWPRWTMREVEHTLCEWDKYERARLGQGRPRGVYPH